MKRAGAASVWLGTATSQAALRKILGITYTEDGEAIPSAFAATIEAADNDPDFSEWNFRQEPTRSVRDLVSPHSYGDQIVPQVIDMAGDLLPEPANAVVLWYHYDYDGTHRDIIVDGISIEFVGVVLFDVGQ